MLLLYHARFKWSGNAKCGHFISNSNTAASTLLMQWIYCCLAPSIQIVLAILSVLGSEMGILAVLRLGDCCITLMCWVCHIMGSTPHVSSHVLAVWRRLMCHIDVLGLSHHGQYTSCFQPCVSCLEEIDVSHWCVGRVSSGQGKVREIPDLAKVREKSGNFVEGQGKKWILGKVREKSGNLHLVQSK